MGWKDFFKFGWIKLIIAVIVALICYNLQYSFIKIGGTVSFFGWGSFFNLIYLLSVIYIFIIVIIYIVGKFKNKKEVKK